MVFGWKKKPQRQESEKSSTTEKEIKLSEIKPILDDIKFLRTKTIISEAQYFQKKIEFDIYNILNIINQLERDNLKVDNIDKHLQILVVRGKKLVVSTIKNETSSKLPELKTYDDVVTLHSMIALMLKRMGDVLGRQSRVIHIFAKKYASKLKDHISTLNSHRDSLKKPIDNYSILNQNVSYIDENIAKYNESNKIQSEKTQRISELKKSIIEFEKTIETTTDSIKKLQATEKYSKYLDIQKQIESLSNEKNQINNRIDLQFTKISRPLSKYVYISSLDKHQKILMENLIENPFDVLTSQNRDDIIKILSAVRKAVESGSVSVKDSQRALHSIDKTIEMIDSLISQTTEFTNKKIKLAEELGIFDTNQLKQMENNLDKTKNNKTEAEEKIQKLDNEISDLKKSIPNILIDIETKLRSNSATKYHIKV